MTTDTKKNDAAGVRTEYGGQSLTRFKITWTKPPATSRRESMRDINKRLAADHDKMLKRAEANSIKLTGKPRL